MFYRRQINNNRSGSVLNNYESTDSSDDDSNNMQNYTHSRRHNANAHKRRRDFTQHHKTPHKRNYSEHHQSIQHGMTPPRQDRHALNDTNNGYQHAQLPAKPPTPPLPPHTYNNQELENPAYMNNPFIQLMNMIGRPPIRQQPPQQPQQPQQAQSNQPIIKPPTPQLKPSTAATQSPRLPPFLQQLQGIEGIEIIPIQLDGSGIKSLNPTEQLISQLLKQRMKRSEAESEESESEEETFVVDPTKDYKIIEQQIETLDDLIKLCDMWSPELTDEYNIDLHKLSLLKEPLIKLKNVIGMDKVKKQIVQHVIYFLQGYGRNEDMLHMTIQGPPGTGKTMIGEILGEIYFNLGIIKGKTKKGRDGKAVKSNELIFKKVRRSDLIGEYLGHTAVKTQKIIDECEGGILFIDEAYSLGNKEGKDNFSKECIDTINQNLTEKKNKFICIVAGYPDELDSCFFSYNPGLRRRFPFNYTIDPYTEKELEAIFRKKVLDNKWKMDDALSNHLGQFMKTNKSHFPHFGGDIETLFFICKMGHAMRTLNCHPRERTILTVDDLENGFKSFKHNRDIIGYKRDNTHYSYYT
jgi:stage V sporulation protein K